MLDNLHLVSYFLTDFVGLDPCRKRVHFIVDLDLCVRKEFKEVRLSCFQSVGLNACTFSLSVMGHVQTLFLTFAVNMSSACVCIHFVVGLLLQVFVSFSFFSAVKIWS